MRENVVFLQFFPSGFGIISFKKIKERSMKRFFIVILLVMPLVLLMGQEPEKKSDVWEPFQFFIGKWLGTGAGKSGESALNREYDFKFNKKFIYYSNRAVFKPTEKNKKGEIHEDFGVFSYDSIRKKHIFRQFHGEGFVNHYVVEISPDGMAYTLSSENIENLPPGWKVRLVIKIEDKDKFSEKFELAGPGKDFSCLITNQFTREK
jgi:hypothetical protein